MEEALVPLGLMTAGGAGRDFNRMTLVPAIDGRGTAGGPIRPSPAQRVATGTNENASSGYSQAGGSKIPQLLMRHELMSELYRQGSAMSPHHLNAVR